MKPLSPGLRRRQLFLPRLPPLGRDYTRTMATAPKGTGFACLPASLLPPRRRGRIRLGSAILGKVGKKRLPQIPTKVLRGRDAHISGRTLSSFLGKRHLFCNEKPCSVMVPEGKTVISGRINVFCIP